MSDKDNAIEVLKQLLSSLRRYFSQGDTPPDLPSDPYAERTAPKKRGPQDRGAAAAVAEPDDESGAGCS